jgi:outer membrane protein TolC
MSYSNYFSRNYLSHRFAILLALPFFAGVGFAQSGSGNTATQAQQVPLSGRQSQQSGSVVPQQRSSGVTSSTVNTSVTTIQVQGAYAGSVNGSETGSTNIVLTLDQAVQMGLKFNLGSVSAGASSRQVRAQRLAALSALLPSIDASLSETGAKTNLETLGLTSGTFGGGTLPKVVGPYHYYDARLSLNYNVLDLAAVHNYRQAKETASAAEWNDRDARELVVLAVGGQYLRIAADLALVESQEAEVRYAQSSYEQARAQLQAGTKSEVDTQRSQVELQTEQQRLLSQRADVIKEKRALARSIGLSLETDFTLAEKLTFDPFAPADLQGALKIALSDRADLKSAEAQLRAAEESLKAAHSERLPTVSVSGYVAVEGVNPNAGNGVFQGTASVSVPIFQGGRIKAAEEQARAAIDQRRAEFQDQRGVIELDVRNAYTDFQVAVDQVKVAESNRDLALRTLQQSQDRFVAGVATSVEVVQSQESLAAANRDYVSGLYAHNLSKISLARALGRAETGIANILKGQ